MNKKKFEEIYKIALGEDANLIGNEKFEDFADLIVETCADFLKDVMDDHFAAEQLIEYFKDE